ncbi:MAG: ABC transporter ATP-binding protein [Solobacterium sp.]|nr:ABC transporter ATP-binding protein [Solobacterium sp.]
MSYIEFRNVTKTYHVGEVDIRALDGVNFSVEKGEFVVIAGASGAGKSTILNILGGMDQCTDGEIEVDGVRIDEMDEKELTDYRRFDIGFVFQFYNLVQNLTARENVELATEISRDPLDVVTTLEQVGLKERMNNFPSQLSGGEQQRVAIARALAKNPKLLLCDEPTGALDYVTGKQILQLLQDTCRTHGMTVIIITHNLALCPMGDRVFRVKSGRIVSAEYNEHPQDIASIEW